MGIKIKNRDPKPTEFKPTDIIINSTTGNIFYKNNKYELFKIEGSNTNIQTTTTSTKQTTSLHFSFTVTSNETSELFIPFNSAIDSINAGIKSYIIPPYNGTVKKLSLGIRSQDTASTQIAIKYRKAAGNDFDLDENGDVVESIQLPSTTSANNVEEFIFTNATFLKGDQIAFTFRQNNPGNDNIEVMGTVVLEYEID